MAWIVEDRRNQNVRTSESPLLTEQMKQELAEKYFPRYPTKRAVTLPALHMVQHHHGWIPMQAIEEIAAFLELAPAEVLDTASFYEEYWLKPKGQYLVQVCRSLACEICGSRKLTDEVRRTLKLDSGETTDDGRFTLIELECLGSCGTAPAMLINEVLHENVDPSQVGNILQSLPPDPHDHRDPSIDWEKEH